MPPARRGEVEREVLQALSTQQATSLAELYRHLPHHTPGSLASALSHLTADRSVHRVRRGLYRLTQQGQTRRETHSAPDTGHTAP